MGTSCAVELVVVVGDYSGLQADPTCPGEGTYTVSHSFKILTGPFVLRLFSLSKHGLVQASVPNQLRDAAPTFYQWAQQVIEQPAVVLIYKESTIVEATRSRVSKFRAQPYKAWVCG